MTKQDILDKICLLCKNAESILAEIKLDSEILASGPDADEAYERGLNDAWNLAKRIVLSPNDGGLLAPTIEKIFGSNNWFFVMRTLTASEALTKVHEYEERQKAEAEGVKVGDEVVTDRATRFVVTFVYDDGKRCAGYGSDGKHCGIETAYCHKTGRHFPEIAAVLEQMRGE